jgi:hypothetical protein
LDWFSDFFLSHFENQNGGFLKKLKVELSNEPAILLLSIFLKEHMSAYNRDTCTHMFMTAVFKKPSYRISTGACPQVSG